MIRWGDRETLKVTELHLVKIRLININKYQQVIGVWVQDTATRCFPLKSRKTEKCAQSPCIHPFTFRCKALQTCRQKKFKITKMKHWRHSPCVFILLYTAPRSCFQTFYFSPFKRGRTNKQIWRLLACLSVSNHTGRTDRRDRQAACGMMNKELISVAQKAARHISIPAQFTAGHHISQPACLHVSLHCCLSHSGRLSLSLSLWQPDTVFVAILVFLCTAQCACVCVIVVYAEKLTHQLIEATQHRL